MYALFIPEVLHLGDRNNYYGINKHGTTCKIGAMFIVAHGSLIIKHGSSLYNFIFVSLAGAHNVPCY